VSFLRLFAGLVLVVLFVLAIKEYRKYKTQGDDRLAQMRQEEAQMDVEEEITLREKELARRQKELEDLKKE